MKLFNKSTHSKNRKQKRYNTVPRYRVDVRVTANSGTKNNNSYKPYKKKR